MKKLSELILKLRWVILIVVVILTAFFTYQIQFIRVDSNIVDALPKTDSVVQLFKQVGERYGSNEIGLVVIESENVFNPTTLNHIAHISDTLSEMEGVSSARSITNLMSFTVDDDNFEVDNIIPRSKWPANEQEADSLRDLVTQNDLVAGTMVSKDGTAAAIIISFETGIDIKTTATEVRKMIYTFNFPEPIYFAGATFLTSYVAEIISTDMFRLIPISFLLIAGILFLSFKSARGVILPLLTAGLAILWAIGTFALLGYNLSMVSNNVPIIILAVGSAYAIHVVNRINQSIEKSKNDAISKSLHLIALPVFLSGLTTMIGFVSFVFGAYLSMIRDFGLLAALGTLYASFLALVFVPATLSLFNSEKSITEEDHIKVRKPFMYRAILKPLCYINVYHPKRIVAVWLVLVVIGVLGIFRLERSVSVADYFKKSHPANIADRLMDLKLGGSKPLFVVFKGNVQSPEVLNAMLDFSSYLVASPYVTSAQSVADIVKKLNRALGGESDIPEEEMGVQQLWFILGQQDLSQLVTEDLDEGVIIGKFNNYGQSHIGDFNEYVNAYFAANRSDGYTIEMTGMPYVNVQLDRSLIRSQLTSLLIAIVLVIILVSLIFKSFWEGLFASVPIISTIAILYGFMGISGIPLNVVTVLVASVAMGIGIDYSIHFISHFNLAIKSGKGLHEAAEDTILVSGKAIIVNFISVSAGFLVLVFSELMPMVYFGLLIALSMLGSSMGALTLLPAILHLGKRKQLLEEIRG